MLSEIYCMEPDDIIILISPGRCIIIILKIIFRLKLTAVIAAYTSTCCQNIQWNCSRHPPTAVSLLPGQFTTGSKLTMLVNWLCYLVVNWLCCLLYIYTSSVLIQFILLIRWLQSFEKAVIYVCLLLNFFLCSMQFFRA